jgi:hypothetical protein
MSRYIQASEPASVASLKQLIQFIEENSAGDEDQFSKTCKEQPFMDSYLAQECVEAIKTIPSEDLSNYVFMARQDLMCQSSFVWDLRKGEIPETGSRSTVGHHRVDLAPGLDYFKQFTRQGDLEKIAGCRFFYSESRCEETRKELSRLLGSEWHEYKVVRKPYQGGVRALIVVFCSRVASEVDIGFTIVGQGKIVECPPILREMAKGNKFFNVLDAQHKNAIRKGWDGRGEVWQF